MNIHPLYSFSWHPHKPCILLRFQNVTVLLDCAVDFASFNHFLPHLYDERSRLKCLPSFRDDLRYLKLLNDNVFIEGVPEVHPIPTLPMNTVDYILISNWQSLVALPFYVNNSGFRGTIYTTGPVVQFGRLMILELIEYFERIVFDDIGKKWKDPSIYCAFANAPTRNPLEWMPFYSKDVMEQALQSITTVSFNQPIVSVLSLHIFVHQVGYLTSSSTRSTHSRSIELEKLQDADALILTSLGRTPELMSQTVLDTLKRGGNVLMPVSPVGSIFDLIDVVSRSIDNGGSILETRIYFISPVAKGALAYSNVNAEWLSESRQNAVYVPEEPFCHIALVRNGRLKLYSNIYESFCREYKTPCVVFTGHPSLRLGDAPHLLEMWGNDSKNALIMTDPDYPLNEVYRPYEELAIRAFYYPIETRLEFSQLNSTLLPIELKPKVSIDLWKSC
uniref:Beta-Casp domain-containing protein n=1 Tax=Angiostrongylus cantonensis TaxID=6313 RepID=A0A0K0DDN2_ANGCA